MKPGHLIISILVVALSQRANFRVIQEEIYNGLNAVRGQFPYQLLLIQQSEVTGGYTFCGGSLISTQYALTAGHCVYQINFTRLYTGLVNTGDPTGVTSYDILKAGHFLHPSYDPNNLQNDIALLKLPSTISTNQYVNTIKLPKKAQAPSNTFNNRMVTASGWGQTQDTEEGIHKILQYRNIHVYPHSQCVTYYSQVNAVTNGMICTDKKVVHAGPCHGDSGGPLTLNGTDGKPVVIGAVSWGVGNCSSDNPVVFTNVAYYLQWINSVTGITIS